MTFTIRALFEDVIGVTTDSDLVRWPLSVLGTYYNDALRAVANLRPDASTVEEDFTCVEGYVQELPDGSTQLIQPGYNVTHSSKRAITTISGARLDAAAPGWRGGSIKGYVHHVLYDVRNPLVFENYPPVAAGTQIHLVRGVTPEQIELPEVDAVLDDIDDLEDCPLQDKYRSALREYMLHRCYDMDADGTSTPERSQNHLLRFGIELGVDIKSKVFAGPRKASTDSQVTTKPASDGAP